MSYLPSRGVYRYEYSLAIPSTATGRLHGWTLEVRTATPQNISDPDLTNDASRRLQVEDNYALVPEESVVVGMQSPIPSKWGASVTETQGAKWFWSTWDFPDETPVLELYPVGAGSEIGGFVLESKSPPGERTYRIFPERRVCLMNVPAGSDFPAGFRYSTQIVSGTAFGPKLESEIVKFSGGGQQATDVNLFLRYSRPTENHVALGAGTTSYDLVVFYGSTTQPTSFAASLDGLGVGGLFHPVPGTAEVVRIPLHSGRNVLSLSIVGTKVSGQTATDTDRLTFLVP